MQFLSFDIIIYWDKKATNRPFGSYPNAKSSWNISDANAGQNAIKSSQYVECFTNLSCRGFTYYVQQLENIF